MSKMWDAMNDLEMLALKVTSAREIIDVAVDAIQAKQNNKAETLMNAAHEFLGYYLDEFDAKFKIAWHETVVKQKDDCMPPWGHSDMEALKYTDEELDSMCDHAEEIEKENLVRSWHIDVEEAYDKNGETIFSYLQFPESLIERMGLKPDSKIQWIVEPDGTVVIRKIQ